MEFIAERNDLLAAIERCGAVIEARTTIPILTHLMLQTQGGTLVVTGTDLDCLVRAHAAGQVVAEGATCVGGKHLADILKALPKGAQVKLRLDAENHRLLVQSGKSRFRLAVLPVADFPDIKMTDAAATFSLPGKKLAAMIGHVVHAISSEETRYYLNGILFQVRDAQLHLVATDGHRLAVSQCDAPEGMADAPDMIVPTKLVRLLLGLSDAAQIDFSASATKITIDAGGVHVLGKLIDGSYPDWTRVVPAKNDTKVTVDAAALAESARRVALICSEKTRVVNVDVSASTILLAAHADDGDSAEEVACTAPAETDLKLALNARYLADQLALVEGEAVFAFADATAPILMTSTASPHAKWVLMPHRR